MAAVGYHNETGSPNPLGDLPRELRRRRFVALANENQRRAGNRRKPGARVPTAQDRLLLAQVSLDASCFGHLPDYAFKRFIAMSFAMHVNGESLFGNLRVATFLGEPHQEAAAFGLLRRIGT